MKLAYGNARFRPEAHDGANAHVRQFHGCPCAAVRATGRFGIDDQVDARRKGLLRDLACGQLENTTCAAGCDSNAPWSHMLGESDDAHLPIQKNDVDRKAHAHRVNAAAGHEQQAFVFGNVRLA